MIESQYNGNMIIWQFAIGNTEIFKIQAIELQEENAAYINMSDKKYMKKKLYLIY